MQLFSYLRPPKTNKEGRPRDPLQNIVRIRCDHCNDAEFDIKYKALEARKTGELCKSCAIKITQAARKRNPTTDAVKAKIKAAFTPELRAEFSKRFSGAGNAGYQSGKWAGRNDKHNAHLAAWKGKTNVEIYGVEKAQQISKRLSAKCSGENNPMYGKPAPIGSGSGWSGWLDGSYFRSLLELSFMLQYDKATSAEKISIEYVKDDVRRTYRPDFVLGDKIIELKPKAMLTLEENQLKFAAARRQFNDRFVVLTEDDIVKITVDQLKTLVDNGRVKLTEKYIKRLHAYISPN